MDGKVYTSNRWEALSELLFQEVHQGFKRRLIITQSEGVKASLQNYFLERSEVSFGVKFLTLKEAVDLLLGLLSVRGHFPTGFQLALHIESHLKKEGSGFTFATIKRRQDFADHLAKLFLRYGKEEMVGAWQGTTPQGRLYREVFKAWDDPASVLEVLKGGIGCDVNLEIHLYGLSTMHPIYLKYFEVFREIWPISLYLLSPTPHFMGEGHRLIERFGKVGRSLQSELSEMGFADHPLFVAPKEGQTQLEALRHSLHHNAPFEGGEKDTSLVIAKAPTRLHELELLKQELAKLMHERADLLPKDVVVMAPDISLYASHISLVFADSPFDVTVSDLPIDTINPRLRAFKTLLNFVGSPFYREDVIHFFSLDEVRAIWDLPEKEEIDQWTRSAHIRYGIDVSMRDRLMGEGEKVLERRGVGTFEEGFFHLVMGLAMCEGDEGAFFPAKSLELSQAEKLGQLIEGVRALYKAVHRFESEEMTLEQWRIALCELAEMFIEKGGETVAPLVAELMPIAKRLPHERFSFSSLKKGIDRALSKQTGQRRAKNANSLTFSSMRAGRAHSASLIYLLGMEAFPKGSSSSSLDELKLSQDRAIDEDHYLFLELILSARHYLVMSYLSLSPDDGKPQGVPLLLKEMARCVGDHITEIEWKESDIETTSEAKEKLPCVEHTPSEIITISQLNQCARHPIKFYLAETLGVRFPFNEEDRDGEFVLSHLNRYRLQQMAWDGRLNIETLKQKGRLPYGPFEQLAIEKLDKIEKQEAPLWVELREGVKEAYMHTDKRLVRPPLKVGKWEIVGCVGPISEEGLLAMDKKTYQLRLKKWPLFLVFLNLKLEDVAPNMVYIVGRESFDGDPKEALERYINYYCEALKRPSPLHPTLAKPFFEGRGPFQKALKLLGDEPYLSYLRDSGSLYTLWEGDSSLPKELLPS